jgi:hypothetical protein
MRVNGAARACSNCRAARFGAILLLFSAVVLGCSGTTGSELVRFRAAAAGPSDAMGAPLEFDNERGFHVTLSSAELDVGALYLNQYLPVSGSQATNCILPGTYVGQVTEALAVDLLSAELQYFPGLGEGTSLPALAGEVWFTRGDVNDPAIDVPALSIAGSAEKDGATFPFTGNISIGANRVVPSPDPAQPGSRPICKERIVSPIPVSIALGSMGTLVLRVDPRLFLAAVDFASLSPNPDDSQAYAFGDDPSAASGQNQASIRLYQALHAAGGPYGFEWLAAVP